MRLHNVLMLRSKNIWLNVLSNAPTPCSGHFRSPQAMDESQRRLHPGGGNVTNEEKRAWLAQAEAYLQTLHMQDKADDGENPLKVKKLHRLKVYQSLVKLDTSFQDLGLPGLTYFQQDSGADVGSRPLRSLRFFVYSPDQEGSGLSAYFAMAFQYGICVWPKFDEMHRVHNDICLGIGGAGMRSTIMLCTILFNLPWGPWTSCSWFERLREEAACYFTSASASDPIFRHMLDRIHSDSPESSLAAGIEVPETTFEGLSEAAFLHKKRQQGLIVQMGIVAEMHEGVGTHVAQQAVALAGLWHHPWFLFADQQGVQARWCPVWQDGGC